MPEATVNGIRLAWESRGDPEGIPLLLIMGLGLPMIAWPDAFCDALAEQGYRVIRFDNRDCGKSTRLDHLGTPKMATAMLKSLLRLPVRSNYKLDDMARDAVGLLDVLGVENAHIVDASMGGMIAQVIAGRYPQRTLSLTSIMSTTGRRSLPGPTAAARRVLLSRPDSDDRKAVIAHLVRTFKVIGSPGYPASDAELRAKVEALLDYGLHPPGTLRQLVAIAASGNRCKLLQTIRVPALVIHGTVDPLVRLECGRDTARHIPGAVLREIEGMGHDLPRELLLVLADMIGKHCASVAMPRLA